MPPGFSVLSSACPARHIRSNVPLVEEWVADALQVVRDVRAALATGRLFCACCQEAYLQSLPCDHLRQAAKM